MRRLIINVPINIRDKANKIIDLIIDEDLIEGRTNHGVHAMSQEGYLSSTVNENIVSVEWITVRPSNGIRDDD